MESYDSVDLTLQCINDTFNNNMKLLEQKAPDIHKMFLNFTPANGSLSIEENGEINIIVNNEKIYPYNPEDFARKQVETFRNPNKVNIPGIDEYTYDSQFLLHKYLHQIADMAKTHQPPKDYAALMIVIGIGLGYHIEYLMAKFDIKHLIIYEPNIEIFYLSLCTVNWQKIFEDFDSRNGTLNLVLSDDVNAIVNKVKTINPVFINKALVYQHLEDKQVFSSLSEKILSLGLGFGFYDDEKWSLQHTIANIKNKVPVCSGSVPPNLPPAFIIGAGPSLDDTIEVIKKYKDKAIVFSCGSALRTLEREGIKPDFHIEIERTHDTYDALDSIDHAFLKELSIIGNNTLHPEVFGLFGSSFMFVKGNDTGMLLFPDSIRRIEYSNPTVTNAGLALAIDSGFENIYLFGVDMGFKDPCIHHSGANIAMDRNNKFYCSEILNRMEVDGNFGGRVYSTPLLLSSKDTIESLLSLNNSINVYNCSDGAKIKRTITLEGAMVKINEMYPKDYAIQNIKNRFSNNYLQDFDLSRSLRQLYNETSEIIDLLLSFLDKEIKDSNEIVDIFYLMYQKTNKCILLRGSVLHFQNLIYSYCLTTKNEIDFINKSFLIFKNFLDNVRADIVSIIDY